MDKTKQCLTNLNKNIIKKFKYAKSGKIKTMTTHGCPIGRAHLTSIYAGLI